MEKMGVVMACVALALMFISPAQACEQCPASLILKGEAAARSAPLVLLGKRVTGVGKDDRRSGLEDIKFKVVTQSNS
jgi:hypothetical protein